MRLFILLLQRLARLVCKRPGAIVITAVLLTLLSGWLAVTRLTMSSDQDRLVSETLPFQKTYLDFIDNFKDQEYLYVVIDGRDAEKAKAFADDLAARLAKSPDLIRQVTYRIGPKQLGNDMLLYLDSDQAEALARQVESLAPSLRPALLSGRLDELFAWIGRRLSAPQSADQQGGSEVFFEVLEPLFDGLTQSVKSGAPYHSPLARFSDEELHNYTFSDNGRFLVMLIDVPKDYSTSEVIERPLAAIRRAMTESRRAVPGVEAGLTGRPVLQADEMRTTSHDMTRATIIAVAGVSLLFILAFGSLLRPLLAVATLLISIVWTLGLAAATVGTLNLLSGVFTLVIVGVGINWGMHLLARYQEERERGLPAEEALSVAMTTAAVGNLTCAATSSAAFFCALFTDFKALAELGFIAGSGILLSLIAMLTLYPALLLLVDRRLGRGKQLRLARLAPLQALVRRPGLALAGAGLITVALSVWSIRLRFDDNLLKLQSMGLDSVKWELALLKEGGESTWFAATQVDTLDDAERLEYRLSRLPTVAKVTSLLDILPTDQYTKRQLLGQAGQALSALAPRTDAPADPAATERALRQIADGLELIEEKLFAAGREADITSVRALIDKVDAASTAIGRGGDDVAGRLAAYQHAFMADLAGRLDQWRPRFHPGRVTPASLPDEVRDRFIGRNARKLIMITPAENIWDPKKMEAFVTQLRSVDPTVTGAPVTSYETARLMRRAFQQTALLSLAVVIALVWIHFQRWRAVALAFIPLLIGLAWLLGGMGLFDISFNLANFFAIPILIGTGIDGGIQMVQRMYEQPRRPMLETSTATSVALSSLTTLLAFGSLMLGQHRGLASLGKIMALGTFSILIATVVVLPAVHERWIRPGADRE
ncbi:MAG TPA: MMPL family transporter [Nitrospiria bacterium]|nr:MMPL family transporter [Nitrospiria bacterium]